jgi:hypothetical protein
MFFGEKLFSHKIYFFYHGQKSQASLPSSRRPPGNWLTEQNYLFGLNDHLF